MKAYISIAAAGLAVALAPAATAQTFVTTPGTYTYSGSGVLVQKGNGPQLTCDLSFDITNDGSSITADNPVLTGNFGFCDTVVFVSTPYTVTVSGLTVSLLGVYADTTITPGDCAGTLTATYSSGPETLDFNAILPEVGSGTGDCTVQGAISN